MEVPAEDVVGVAGLLPGGWGGLMVSGKGSGLGGP